MPKTGGTGAIGTLCCTFPWHACVIRGGVQLERWAGVQRKMIIRELAAETGWICCGVATGPFAHLSLTCFSLFFACLFLSLLPCLGFAEMAKSKNHTNHNQNFKAHRNGIKRPTLGTKISTKGVSSRALAMHPAYTLALPRAS